MPFYIESPEKWMCLDDEIGGQIELCNVHVIQRMKGLSIWIPYKLNGSLWFCTM
jgi:hypothetical protein